MRKIENHEQVRIAVTSVRWGARCLWKVGFARLVIVDFLTGLQCLAEFRAWRMELTLLLHRCAHQGPHIRS